MSPEHTAWRALGSAERYYWLLDQLGPMNIAAVAELDRQLDPTELKAALDTTRLHHPLLGARIDIVDDVPVFADAGEPIALSVLQATDDWLLPVESALDTPFTEAAGALTRCLYCPARGTGRSTVVLAVHHSIADGLGAVRALQQILRTVDAPDPAGDLAAVVPPPIEDRFPAAFTTARAVVAILREVQEERRELPTPAAYPFLARDQTPQSTCLDRLAITATDTQALRGEAHATGSTVNGMLAAAVLEAAADLLGPSAELVLNLATPTDLRRRVEPPLDTEVSGVAIGLLCTPYAVPGGDNLPVRIARQTRREVERGESHLFYRIARAAAYDASVQGLAAFGEWVSTTQENVGVSNLGVVDHTADPDWVRTMSFALSPSSNQVAFVAVTTYRGRLALHVATDRSKLPDDVRARFVDGLLERIPAHPAR